MGDRVRHLRVSLPVSGVLTLAYSALVLIVDRPLAAAGAALGVTLVTASYALSTVAIARADSVNPQLVFPVGMGMYVLKFSLFGAMMIAVGATDWPGRVPMALGIVLGVIAWTAVQIWWTVRHAHPYVTPR